jgi:arabinose-5-phosphate isomerase
MTAPTTPTTDSPPAAYVAKARAIVSNQADALHRLAESIGPSFTRAIEQILALAGPLVVTGLGKSGLVARKVAATMTSTGTPAIYMHPVEALHGDLGIVTRQTGMLAFSKSGNTEEVLRLMGHFKALGGSAIAVCQDGGSKLAELADVVLPLPDVPEAGAVDLVPTTSVTLMMALGDALALSLMEARGFTADDFLRFHPEGLGKRMLLRARDLMCGGPALPVVNETADFDELLEEIDAKRLGIACVVNSAGHLMGTLTDGDLRRVYRRVTQPRDLGLAEIIARSRRDLNKPPGPALTVREDTLVVRCGQLMRDHVVTHLVVVDEQFRPVGLLRQQDLMAEGAF